MYVRSNEAFLKYNYICFVRTYVNYVRYIYDSTYILLRIIREIKCLPLTVRYVVQFMTFANDRALDPQKSKIDDDLVMIVMMISQKWFLKCF